MIDTAEGRPLNSALDADTSVFERSPVALWDQDFTRVGQWLSRLRAAGVQNLSGHFQAHPEELDEGISLVDVTRANGAALDLIEADSPARLFSPEVLTPEVRQAFGVTFQAIWNGSARFELEVEGRTMTGERIDSVLHWSAPIVDGQPDYSNVLIAIFDVTHQRRLESLRAEAAELFVAVYETAPVAACLITTQGQVFGANKAFCELTGYQESELVEMTLGNLIHSYSVDRVLAKVSQSLSGRLDAFEVDTDLLDANHESLSTQIDASLVRDSDNQPSYLICQLTETRHKTAGR